MLPKKASSCTEANRIIPILIMTAMFGLMCPLTSFAQTNWTNRGPEGGRVLSFAFDPTTPGTMYAGVFNQPTLYKSTDGGDTWTAKPTGIPQYNSVGCLAIAPSAPSTLYACWSGVYKSTDGGANWIDVTTSGEPKFVGPLLLESRSPQVLFAATESGVYTRDLSAVPVRLQSLTIE